MRATAAAPLPLIVEGMLHPGGASRLTSLRAIASAVLAILILTAVATAGILVLLPAALGAVATQALSAA